MSAGMTDAYEKKTYRLILNLRARDGNGVSDKNLVVDKGGEAVATRLSASSATKSG
jgi:hypothetical protein